MEVLLQVIDKEPASPLEFQPRLDPDLAQICLKCLRKNPEEQHESAEARFWRSKLEQWLDRGAAGRARARLRAERLWQRIVASIRLRQG